MQTYDIDFINTAASTVDYNAQADEIIAAEGDPTDQLVAQFVSEYKLQSASADNIGGLIVYTREDTVVAVYDYETFVGWVV
jgi:hypothetical protein